VRSVYSIFPEVRQELIDLSGRRRRQSGEDVLYIVKRIDFVKAAGLNDRHPNSCGATTLDGAGEEPVILSKHRWSQSIFGSVVVTGYESGFGVVAQGCPLIVQVRDGLAQGTLRRDIRFLLVDPGAQGGKARYGSASAQRFPAFFIELRTKAFDVEKALHDRERVVDLFGIFFSRILEIAECMRRTAGARGATFDNTVVNSGTISKQHSLEARQHSFRMASIVLLGEVEKYISFVAVKPGITLMNLAEPFFDHRHFCGIRLDEPGVEHQLVHALDDEVENVGSFFEPARHGCTGDWNSHGTEYALLAIQRQVPIELSDASVCNESGRGKSFVNGLIRFGCRDDMSPTVGAGVFEFDMFEQLEDCTQNVKLIRWGLGAICSPLFSAFRASKQCGVRNFVLDGAFYEPLRDVPSTTAVKLFVRHQLQIGTFLFKFGLVAVIHGFAGAGQGLAWYLGGAFPKDHAVAAPNLFFQLRDPLFQFFDRVGDCAQLFDLSAQVLDDFVALGEVIRQVIRVRVFDWNVGVGHEAVPVF